MVSQKTSKKQVAANRRNAKKSTGPRTAAGKARSSLNAFTHGILSKHAFLPGEDSVQFAIFQMDLFEDLAPQGAAERLLADRVVDCAWRLRRILETQHSALRAIKVLWDGGLFYDDFSNGIPGKSRVSKGQWDNYQDSLKPDLIGKDELSIWVTMHKALKEQDYQSILHRYEVQYERSMYKAMNQLERMQARRRGQRVLAPVAVDISLSGTETQNN